MKPSFFLSYAHADTEIMTPIKGMLNELQRDDQIAVFHDGEIRAGQLWDEEIDRHLRRASHILLGISDHYIGSDYVRTNELPVIKDRMRTGSAKIFPLLLKGREWRWFIESERASFLKSAQFWPFIEGHRALMADLSIDDQGIEIMKLRAQLLINDRPTIEPDEDWWAAADEAAISADLSKFQLPDTVAVKTMSVQLPSYLAEAIACGDVAALVSKANGILYDIDRSSFPKRRIPEPPIDLLNKEEAFWTQVLLDLSRRSPLSIVTLLALIYRQAPGVRTSIEGIIGTGEGGTTQ